MHRKKYIIFVAFFMFMSSYTMQYVAGVGKRRLPALGALRATGLRSSNEPLYNLLLRGYACSISNSDSDQSRPRHFAATEEEQAACLKKKQERSEEEYKQLMLLYHQQSEQERELLKSISKNQEQQLSVLHSISYSCRAIEDREIKDPAGIFRIAGGVLIGSILGAKFLKWYDKPTDHVD